MDSPSSFRISQLSATPTVERQTPSNDFGTVMARTTAEGLERGAAFFSSISAHVPVLSMATGAAAQVVSTTVGASANAVVPVPSVARGPGEVGSVGQGRSEAWDLVEAQRLMQREGASMNAQYLSLQNEMQRESREFNAVTNILKVRHDSAKAAINNIR
jgi:hypothetical protein